VCLCVCPQTPPREMSKYRHFIYGWKWNLSGKVLFVIKSPSDQPSGRYWPKTGKRWKKMIKNRVFLQVFEIFNDLPDKLST
jgi:hypothetical protein